jgi:hypothetical protein
LRSTATISAAPGDAGALDGRDADTAAAEHDDRRAGRDLGGVDRGAGPGHDAAADERRHVEGDVVVDLDDALLGQQRVLGEGAGAGHGLDGLSPSRKWGVMNVDIWMFMQRFGCLRPVQ